ncbi:MAG TPA: biotin/lipoyl-binding protein, partial [Methylibium sp.]|nr:biotin/lipoyl-binding protein [Methylibium sp.]
MSAGLAGVGADGGVRSDDVRALLVRLRRAGLAALAVWLLAFVLWALFAPISGAVVAGGLVKVEANRQSVSHRDGGIVAKVLVREGQQVRRGDTLIVLEDARVDSSVDLLEAQLAAEQLRRRRLEAEASFKPNWVAPPLDATVADRGGRLREAAAREHSAFQAR